MAKKSSAGSGSKGGGGRSAADMIPDGLRDAGKRAADLARNPVARSLLVAGLLTATAALAANKNARDTMKRTAKGARDAAEAATDAAAESANRIGAAMIDAATEAIRRMMGDTGAPRRPRRLPRRAALPKKPAAGSARKTSAKKPSTPGTAKKQSAKAAAARPAAAKSGPARATPARKSAAKKSAAGKPSARKPGAKAAK